MDSQKVLFARLTQKGQRAFVEYVKKAAVANAARAVEQVFDLTVVHDSSLGDVVDGVKVTLEPFSDMEVDVEDWVAKAREDYFLPEDEGPDGVKYVDMSWLRNKRKRSDINDKALVSTLSEEDLHVVKEALKAKYDSFIDTAFEQEGGEIVGETTLRDFTYAVEDHVINM